MSYYESHIAKKMLVGLISIILIAVLLEVVGLIKLSKSVEVYEKYWQKRAEQEGQLTYVALGDSAAQGIGASKPENGYVGQIAKLYEDKTKKSVRVLNYSVSGATMVDYLKEQAPKLNKQEADLITIEIGANDIANFQETKFRSQFRQVLETLPEGSYVANMPIFNSRIGQKVKSNKASLIIKEEMRNHPKLHFVDLYKETSENQSIFNFAADFFHPNDRGYKNWTNAFILEIKKYY